MKDKNGVEVNVDDIVLIEDEIDGKIYQGKVIEILCSDWAVVAVYKEYGIGYVVNSSRFVELVEKRIILGPTGLPFL